MVVWPPPAGNRRSIAVVARSHIHFTPYYRSDTGFDRGFVELKRAKEVAVICHRRSRHSEARNLSSEVRNPDRRIEQRIVGVKVQVDEGWHFGSSAHGAIIARPGGRCSLEKRQGTE